jgi:SMODS-associated and fused to various effectors sensor domain/CHAT domain
MMNKKIKILFLSADPDNVVYRPHLGTEFRDIFSEIERSANRDQFQLESAWAVRTADLQGALMKHRPDMVHFSGHGAAEGIFLEDEAGKKKIVPIQALAQLFELFKAHVRVVFLNACHTQFQLEAMKETIDVTIGMKEPVADAAAMKFAVAFYRALVYGYSVKEAFNLARNQLALDDLPNQDTPVFFTKSGVDASRPLFDSDYPGTESSGNGQEGNLPSDSFLEKSQCIWIHGWVKRLYDRLPVVELDWTEYFQRNLRMTPDHETWVCHLYPGLSEAKKELDKLPKGTFIDLRGKLPLTANLAIGAFFPAVGGYTLRAEQPTDGRTTFWRSDAEPNARRFKVVTKQVARNPLGKDVLIALSITGPSLREVMGLYEQQPENFISMVYAEPDDGPGENALRCDGDAVGLAKHAKELIRSCIQEYDSPRIHLVVYAPAAYCLFLGQRLNALGQIVTYERTSEGGYKPSVIIQTD